MGGGDWAGATEMWLDWRHADAGVGIGMPGGPSEGCLGKSMISMKNDDYGYAKSLKKSVFTVFVFCKKFQKKRCFFRKLPAGGFARKHNNECWEITIINHKS